MNGAVNRKKAWTEAIYHLRLPNSLTLIKILGVLKRHSENFMDQGVEPATLRLLKDERPPLMGLGSQVDKVEA